MSCAGGYHCGGPNKYHKWVERKFMSEGKSRISFAIGLWLGLFGPILVFLGIPFFILWLKVLLKGVL